MTILSVRPPRGLEPTPGPCSVHPPSPGPPRGVGGEGAAAHTGQGHSCCLSRATHPSQTDRTSCTSRCLRPAALPHPHSHCRPFQSELTACLSLPTVKAPPLPLQPGNMQPQESHVHYSRWEDGSRDGVSLEAVSSTEEASCCRRISQKLCSGKLGIAMKVLGGVALFWIIFILGYLTGYYVHKCK
ncbi:small integral membrane protein 1 isoform X1 [Callithrix jacchus]|uniref:Small integral membrane protein 1 (Vel blood group) n=1 Tax=Callithrix jacchus TaxID=9483 RepID=A0A8I3WLS3_CALJA|nr:small integral membrane protein 1 isoform X1 [Callithrix jacchus]